MEILFFANLGFNIYCLYVLANRISTIEEVDEDIMSSFEKEEYTKTLEGYKKIFIVSLLICLVSIIFKEIKIDDILVPLGLILGMISISLSSIILHELFEEMDKFGLNKQEINKVKIFKEKAKEEKVLMELKQKKRIRNITEMEEEHTKEKICENKKE